VARGTRPWRALVFAPLGDGQTRRRGSDVFRVIIAVAVVLITWVITRADSHAEKVVATALSSPPNGLRWLIAALWWITSVGTIGLVAVLAIVSKRWSAVRDIGLSGVVTLVVCIVIGEIAGTSGGRPPDPTLHGLGLSFPVAQVAVTVGVVTAALPYLSRWMQRTLEAGTAVLAVAVLVNGSGLPVPVVASLAAGWGVTAVVHLVFQSPLGLPSAGETGCWSASPSCFVR
jgi:hypothetical protein